MRLNGLVVGALVLDLFVIWVVCGHALRAALGRGPGNVIVTLGLALAVVLVIMARLWYSKQWHPLGALAFLSAAVIFGVLSWFTFPGQARDRAVQRVVAAEGHLAAFAEHQAHGSVHLDSFAGPFGAEVEPSYSPPESPGRAREFYKVLRAERAAREYEFRAVDIRDDNGIGRVRGHFLAWNFAVFSAASLVGMFYFLRDYSEESIQQFLAIRNGQH